MWWIYSSIPQILRCSLGLEGCTDNGFTILDGILITIRIKQYVSQSFDTLIIYDSNFPAIFFIFLVGKGKVRWNLFCCTIYLLQKWPLWNTKMTEMFWKIIGRGNQNYLYARILHLQLCTTFIIFVPKVYVYLHILHNICVCWRRDWIDGPLI